MSDHMKHWLDVAAAVATAISTLAIPILSMISGVLGIIWYGIRIWEWKKGKVNVNLGNN